MGFETTCLVVLFLAVAVHGGSTTLPDVVTSVSPEDTPDKTTEDGQLKPAASSDNAAITPDDSPKSSGKNDDNDGELTLDDLIMFGGLFDADDDALENSKQSTQRMNNENITYEDTDGDSTNSQDSKVATDLDEIRRQGEVNPAFNQKKTNSEIQYDDPKQDVRSDSPSQYSQRSPNFNQDGTFELMEGGYKKPFDGNETPRTRNRYVSMPDSSEQSEKLLEVPDRTSNRQQQGRQIMPQAIYPPQPQLAYNSFRPGPIIRPDTEAPIRNSLTVNNRMPTAVHNGYITTPPAVYTDYPAAGFQSQFPSPDSGIFPTFGRDPNNVAMYQASQRNPFQDTRFLFQGGPQVQPQPILIGPAGNLLPQFQQDALSAFPNFDSDEDNSRSNYAAFFRGPNLSPQFQASPNFFAPNRINSFNNPPVSFLPNLPNPEARLPTQFIRYPPATTDAQNQRNVNNQQPEPDASLGDKKTSTDFDEDAKPANSDDPSSVPFGTRMPDKDETDVYIRYPTNEAGYAVEENLPPRNNSDAAKDGDQQAISEERSFSNVDPYRNALNLLRSNQRRNNSFGFPPPSIFGNSAIDFGYQRPQNQILLQYPDRNQDLSSFPGPDFNSGNPFDALTSLPENNYAFPNVDTQRRGNQELVETPTCAKQSNASICFEDGEYPRNDILYSLNSNSFLVDRLSGYDKPVDSIALVEQNSSLPDQASENYACTVDTKYGTPLRAKNVAGIWSIIVRIQGRFSQPVRLEVCKSLGDSCKYADSRIKTTCVQKYAIQRLLTWSPGRGVYSDTYKLPVACSCQIREILEL